MDYVLRRLSSLAIVVGGIAGFLTASLVESVGLAGPIVLGTGLLAFVVVTFAIGTIAHDHAHRRRSGPSGRSFDR